jgi:hypothetical protein
VINSTSNQNGHINKQESKQHPSDAFDPDALSEQLRSSLFRVLRGVPGCSMRPTDLSRSLDVSRVMVSRIISAISKENKIETLTSIPGPETLRSVVRSAQSSGVESEDIQPAMKVIDLFDDLIREQFGTRAALNAALSVEHADTRDRFEQSSRYQVFKGMSQVMGVESKIWLTCMMLTPSKTDEHLIDITTIHGTSGLRRLRPDMPVLLSYGTPPRHQSAERKSLNLDLDLTQFFTHTPAPLTVIEESGQVVNTFAPKIEGKDAVYDMLASVHIPGGSSRVAGEGRSRRGTSVIPDVPVVTLVSDVVIHGDIFEGIDPELYVYKTMGKGGADIEDHLRDIDRVSTNDQIEDLGVGLSKLGIHDIPKYPDMVNYLCEKNGYKPDEFRTHRLQVQYPIYGFQYVIAYKVGE